MFDPDNIQITKSNSPSNIVINNKEIPKCYIEIYSLDDDKELEKFIKDVEAQVRRSYEYRAFINYLRDYMQMNKCAFLKGITNDEGYDIKIEIHHYPFTLRDIVEVVIRKRQYLNESMSLQMVSKEVTKLHYYLIVGLISLSETVHELAHSGKLFIPVDKVMGRYNLFVDYYEQFCSIEQLETLRRIEKYTNELQNDILDTTILNQNNITYKVQDTSYMIPDMNQINTNMLNQISYIKENNYILPSVEERPMIEDKKIKQVISFF